MKIAIYIPQPGSQLATMVEAGSVVLPLDNPRPDGMRAVCWESRTFAERMPSTFADRAERAYERSRDYRNNLRKLVRAGDLLPVGHFETSTGAVEIEFEAEAAAIAAWLGTTALDSVELTTTRGVVVQMVRDSVREHGDRLKPSAEKRQVASSYRNGQSSGFHTAR
jgi:hypothetical protein